MRTAAGVATTATLARRETLLNGGRTWPQVLLGLGYATLTPTHGTSAVVVSSAGARFRVNNSRSSARPLSVFMQVSSAGARLSGVLVQAGTRRSAVLVQIGTDEAGGGSGDGNGGGSDGGSGGGSGGGSSGGSSGSRGDSYAEHPIVVHDLFVRVYAERGAAQARAGTMVRVLADHTIIDHAWLWRVPAATRASSSLPQPLPKLKTDMRRDDRSQAGGP